MLTLWKVKQTYGCILKYLSNPVSQIRRKRQESQRVWKQKFRERKMRLWNGVRKEKREKCQRDLCQKYYLREKWFDLFIFQRMQWVLFQCTYPLLPTMGHGLFTSTPLMHGPLWVEGCAPSPAARSGWSSLLVPPASGYSEKQHLKAGLILFFRLSCVFFSEHVLLLCSWRKQNK